MRNMTPQDVANAKRDRMSKKRFAFPYGDTSFMAGTNQKEVKLKEYRYTGKEKDDATGLYYYGARYYASWLGRWLSADPLFRENPGVYERPKPKDKDEAQKAEAEYMQKLYSEGLNLYCYVKGNPVRFRDENGNYLIEHGNNSDLYFVRFQSKAENNIELAFKAQPLIPFTTAILHGSKTIMGEYDSDLKFQTTISESILDLIKMKSIKTAKEVLDLYSAERTLRAEITKRDSDALREYAFTNAGGGNIKGLDTVIVHKDRKAVEEMVNILDLMIENKIGELTKESFNPYHDIKSENQREDFVKTELNNYITTELKKDFKQFIIPYIEKKYGKTKN